MFTNSKGNFHISKFESENSLIEDMSFPKFLYNGNYIKSINATNIESSIASDNRNEYSYTLRGGRRIIITRDEYQTLKNSINNEYPEIENTRASAELKLKRDQVISEYKITGNLVTHNLYDVVRHTNNLCKDENEPEVEEQVHCPNY